MAKKNERTPRREARRRRVGRWQSFVHASGHLWRRLLETPLLWLVALLLVGTWCLVPTGLLFAPKIEAGTIATRDYVAQFERLVPDEEATRRKRERAREEVLPVYDFDPGVAVERTRQLGLLFAAGRHLFGDGSRPVSHDRALDKETAQTLQAASTLKATAEELQLFARRRFSAELEDRLNGLFAEVMRRGVVGSKELLLENRMRGVNLRNLETAKETTHLDLFDHLGYPDEVRSFVESELRGWADLGARDRRVLADVLLDNIPPNLTLNSSETLARRKAADESTATVYNQIRKGQVIVRKGDEIDSAAASLITSYQSGDQSLSGRVLPAVGSFFLLALVALVVWLGLRHEKVSDHPPRRLFGESLLLLLLSLLGARFSFFVAEALANSFEASPFNSLRSYSYAIPFAALALVAGLLYGRTAAFVLSFLFSLLIARLAGPEALWAVIYSIAGSLAAIYGLDQYQFKQRLAMTRVGLVVGLVNVMMILVLGSLAGGLEGGAGQVVLDLVCGLVGGLGVAAVASFAVPILEPMLSITTDITLIELANTNLPLLRRLAYEAPGTFQHSLMVANLSKQACEEIGADSVLAYTGSLYHDIGKVFRPEYFIENQRPGQNRHDKLQPSMSALILINHIKDGVELARAHHLPRAVVDAIEQHHGTRLIKYFYNRALEQSDPEAGEVAEEKYRYPGPRPQNKVMGVIMLADGVEAASRTLIEPTQAKIRTLIRAIVDDCLRDRQLDETDLTLSDINRIAEAFLRVLANIFHQRIDYPGFDFNVERKESRPALPDVKAS